METNATTPDAGGARRGHIIERDDEIRALLERTRRIAVLGIKTRDAGGPAYYVPAYAQEVGFDVVPVPVYFPEVTEILGQPVHRRLADVPGPIDLVNVFRRSKDVAPHLPDMLAARPAAVWMQSGIRDDAVAEELARAGIDVVQDRCLMVELRYLGR